MPPSCTCNDCVNACKQRPGWFMPGEAERAAELLGMDLRELFRTRLAVDWYEGTPDIFLLAPALVGEQTGTEYPYDPIGRCVFLTADDRCGIHAAKPFECAALGHEDGMDLRANRRAVVTAWAQNQKQIVDLLGREPQASLE